MTIYYSHRPKSGISIGVSVKENKGDRWLVVASSFVKDSCDTFSRNRARQIIEGRINNSEKGGRFVKFYAVGDRFNLGKFMSKFRNKFKPLYNEPDAQNLHRKNSSVDSTLEEIDTMVSLSL